MASADSVIELFPIRRGVQEWLGWQGLADRKSTRLNSSHVRISYAVFCLKKKNKTKYSSQLTHNHLTTKPVRHSSLSLLTPARRATAEHGAYCGAAITPRHDNVSG